DTEPRGLPALMLLHASRRRARFRGDDIVLLADQDRSLWDTAKIEEGRELLERALALHGRGPYALQAAIASLHADRSADWGEIAALYGELSRVTGSPVVGVYRGVAIAGEEGADAGLGGLEWLSLGALL